MKRYFFLIISASFLYIIIIIWPVISLFGEEIPSKKLSLLLFNSKTIRLFLRTITIGGWSAFLATTIGLLLALIFETVRIPLRKLFILFSLVPFFIPPYITAVVWSRISSHIYNLSGVILIFTISFSPFAFLLLTAGMKSINFHLIESAILVSKPVKIFFKVIVPLISPYILATFLFIFVLTFSSSFTPEILRVDVYPLKIFLQFSIYHNFKDAVITSLPLIILTVILGFIIGRFLSNRVIINFSRGYRQFPKSEKFRVKILSLAFLIFIVLIFLIPIFEIIRMIGDLDIFLDEIKMSWAEITNSLYFAFASSFLCLLLVFFICYIIFSLDKSKIGRALNTFIFIPLAIPAPIYALGLIKILNIKFFSPVYISFLPLISLWILRFHPYVLRVLLEALRGIKRELREQAWFFTDNILVYGRKILFPLIKPFLLISWFVCFLFAFQELSGSIILISPGDATLSLKLGNLWHYGAYERVASLSLIEILIPCVIISLILPFIKIPQ